MANRELEELLEKLDNIKRATPLTSDDIDLIVKRIKEERKNDRQTGPAIGQTYWFVRVKYTDFHTYSADPYDLDICENTNIYPEERFAEAELRANELIQAVNKRRRELNESKEFGNRKYHIVYLSNSELGMRETSKSSYDLDFAYPFGLFKDSADCNTCILEFKDELEWFYIEYLPHMAELDDYDWADAPGWGGSDD